MTIDRIALRRIERRSILPFSPQQLKRERGDHGMAKRYRSRRIRKPATCPDGQGPVPNGRGQLQRDRSTLSLLRRRPPNLSSTMPNLRMHHYLRRVRAITSIDRLQPGISNGSTHAALRPQRSDGEHVDVVLGASYFSLFHFNGGFSTE